VNDQKPTAAQEMYVTKMDGYFICDEMAVIVHRLRELIGDSQEHTAYAFMSSANDIYCDLVEVMERGWTTLEAIAEGRKTRIEDMTHENRSLSAGQY
jgi:hypothetical protein